MQKNDRWNDEWPTEFVWQGIEIKILANNANVDFLRSIMDEADTDELLPSLDWFADMCHNHTVPELSIILDMTEHAILRWRKLLHIFGPSSISQAHNHGKNGMTVVASAKCRLSKMGRPANGFTSTDNACDVCQYRVDCEQQKHGAYGWFTPPCESILLFEVQLENA
jgi:hypothetical protein